MNWKKIWRGVKVAIGVLVKLRESGIIPAESAKANKGADSPKK